MLAHQYIHRFERDILHAVLGDARMLVSFRVGSKDDSLVAKSFSRISMSKTSAILRITALSEADDRWRTEQAVQRNDN